MSDTKSFTFFLAKRWLLLVPFTVPNIFNVTIAAISNTKSYFLITTALSKSQATAAERRGKECVSFLTRNARPNFTLPRLSRESCRQASDERGKFVPASEWKFTYTCNERSRSSPKAIFSLAKICEQRREWLILSVLCLLNKVGCTRLQSTSKLALYSLALLLHPFGRQKGG